MADYFISRKALVTKRVADVIAGIVKTGIQYIPATIDNRKGRIYDDYCVVNVRHRVENAIDVQKSDVDVDKVDGLINDVRTLVLDDNVVGRIPINDRLMFGPSRCSFHVLFHQTVVDAVMALDPEPILRFVPLSLWGDDMAFRK